MIKVSLIMPVYNVGKYLAECLDSIINQTYKNFELIAVNDGSTDNSLAILEDFAKKDKRIKVITQKNAGAGAARNTALDLATGDYIGFIDSDDYVDKDFLNKLVITAEENSAEIAACDFNYVYTDNILYANQQSTEIFTTSEYFEKKMSLHYKYYVMVNKIFKKEIVREDKFPVGNTIDDEFFTYKIIGRANKIVFINEGLYYYRQRKSSAMNDEIAAKKIIGNRINVFEQKDEYIAKNFPTALGAHQKRVVDYYLNYCKEFKSDKALVKSFVKKIKTRYKKTVNTEYKGKEKLWVKLFLKFPFTVLKLSNYKVTKKDLGGYFD